MTANLIAGPILRRTTTNRVCVWLATSKPMSLQLTIVDAQNITLEYGQSKLDKLGEQCVTAGENLYIYLLQARSNTSAGYPLDKLMCYRLDEVSSENNSRTQLLSADELQKLVYGSFPYPSFFIPSRLKRLLHGSCRKPHGGFHSENQPPMPDALSHGNTLLRETCQDLEKRPPILLLTGDQIYADDVSLSLFAMLRGQSVSLTGKNETLPLEDGSASTALRLDPSTIPLHGRKQALRDQGSGFSSGESENHLFTFGEFAAMYIYALGNPLSWQPVWEWQTLQNMGAVEDADKAFDEQLAPLRSYHKTLPDIRRLLANISTYMIFDDHDVTDDWNITGDWYDKVRTSPTGRRIVSNALAAYWCFQAWGNDPDNFDKDLVLSITQQLDDRTNDYDIGERYDLHIWKSRGWGFSIPSDPPIIVIDSRTQRQYENKYHPAQLLDRYALDWLRVEWTKLKTGQTITRDTCPILVATTPVIGYAIVEYMQRLALWLANLIENYIWIQWLERLIKKEGYLTGKVVTKLDAESWNSNKVGFVNFMDTISKRMDIKQCVFLSGDVHYAFTAKASFKHADFELNCHQLTSSALSNKPDAKQSKFLKKAANSETVKHGNWALRALNRWQTEAQLLKAENSGLRVNPECNLGLVAFKDGKPVSHTLLTGSGQLVYQLQES